MIRDKAWWARLNKYERIALVELERLASRLDATARCGYCFVRSPGPLCSGCRKDMDSLIAKGDSDVRVVHWYERALKDGRILSWNFNRCAHPTRRHSTWWLMATASREAAEACCLRRIRQGKNGLWYGLFPGFPKPTTIP